MFSVHFATQEPLPQSHYKRDKKYDKKDRYGDSSKTVTKQINKQKQVLSGFVTIGEQDADNCIAAANGANACRDQATGGPIVLVPRS